MSHRPQGQEIQLVWNQESGSQELGIMHLLQLLGSPLTFFHRPAFALSVHTGERGYPCLILKNSSVWIFSTNEQAPLCTNYTFPERTRLAQLGQMHTSGPCSEEAGLGLGWAWITSLMGAGRSQKQRMDRVSHLQECYSAWPSDRKESPLSLP